MRLREPTPDDTQISDHFFAHTSIFISAICVRWIVALGKWREQYIKVLGVQTERCY